jgi:hypothetical protein
LTTQTENIAGLFRKLFLHIGNSLSDDRLGACTLPVELKAVYRPFGLDKHYLYTCLLQVFCIFNCFITQAIKLIGLNVGLGKIFEGRCLEGRGCKAPSAYYGLD